MDLLTKEALEVYFNLEMLFLHYASLCIWHINDSLLQTTMLAAHVG